MIVYKIKQNQRINIYSLEAEPFTFRILLIFNIFLKSFYPKQGIKSKGFTECERI